MTDVDTTLLTVEDYERAAEASGVFDPAIWRMLFGPVGSPGWETLTRNVRAFDSIKLRPRVMVDVSNPKLSVRVLNDEIAFPIMLAPAGKQQRCHADGELASARAAAEAGTVMGLSTAANYSIEELREVSAGPLWFQLYVMRDSAVTLDLIRRAEESSYTALMVTVDQAGVRPTLREQRENHHLGVSPERGDYAERFEADRELRILRDYDMPDVPFTNMMKMGVPLSDLAWLRSVTSLPIVVKGIQTAEDARICVEQGMDALVVSNHGGFAAEGTYGTIEMLPEVADAVDGRLEVYVDGGVRRGSDVFKCLALGAKAVFVGRPLYFGLAVSGQTGVRHVLELLRDELRLVMQLCGKTDVGQIDRAAVGGAMNLQESQPGLSRIARETGQRP